MTLNKIVLPFVLPLAVLLMTTGCPHKNNIPVTKIHQPAVTSTTTPQPDLNTKPLETTEPPPVSTPAPVPYTGGPIDTATNWDAYNMNIDRDKLAAYTVHFKYDSKAVVEDSEQANVASVAQALAADANVKLMIEGHCDERGTEEYNRSLGERRALALREALAKDGLDKPDESGRSAMARTSRRIRGMMRRRGRRNPGAGSLTGARQKLRRSERDAG